MNSYEVVFIVKPEGEEVLENIITKLSNVIKDNGGEVGKIDRWGQKVLAYEIQNYSEGQYVLITFSAAPDTVAELDRVIRITEEILRHMIIIINR